MQPRHAASSAQQPTMTATVPEARRPGAGATAPRRLTSPAASERLGSTAASSRRSQSSDTATSKRPPKTSATEDPSTAGMPFWDMAPDGSSACSAEPFTITAERPKRAGAALPAKAQRFDEGSSAAPGPQPALASTLKPSDCGK